uniref:Ribosomal RNA small subunit methyltransferase E n=1 Tax=candidate division WOR-3 bacterium TaxID=2052148 RepID=A0A7V3UZT7_UNCW3
MEYFYIPELSAEIKEIEISGSEVRHMVKVLRHKPGDEIFATNGRGEEFRLIITRIRTNRAGLKVVEVSKGEREPGHKVALAPAVLKGDKLSLIVEAATELGISEIVPFVSSRVIGRLNPVKLRRMEQVAVSGLKTALRTVLPTIKPVRNWNEFLDRFSDYERVVVAYEEEKDRGVDQVLEPDAKSVLVVIGPEGGFTPAETEAMTAAGGRLFSLGPRRLRAETAAVVATALCLSRLGDLK